MENGDLGEYELSSVVSEQVANGRKEYSGPLAVKHVGFCTRDGPQETTGQIRSHVLRSTARPLRRWCSKELRVYLGKVFSWSCIMAS